MLLSLKHAKGKWHLEVLLNEREMKEMERERERNNEHFFILF
jgi:hypothetical protein